MLSFTFIWFSGISCSPKDSLFISSIEYQKLFKNIIHLENTNVELNQKIIGVQNENDKRIIIFCWAIGLIVVLSIGATVYNFITFKHIVRRQLNEEIKEYKEKFDELESQGIQMVNSLEKQVLLTKKMDI